MRLSKSKSVFDDFLYSSAGGEAREASLSLLKIWREFSRTSKAALAREPQIMALGAATLNLLPAALRRQALAEALRDSLVESSSRQVSWLLSLGPVEEPKMAMHSKKMKLASLADFDKPGGFDNSFAPIFSWCSFAAGRESFDGLAALEDAGFGERDRLRFFDGLAGRLSNDEARSCIFKQWHPWVALMSRGLDGAELDELLSAWEPSDPCDRMAADSAVLESCCWVDNFTLGFPEGIERLAARDCSFSDQAMSVAVEAFSKAFVQSSADAAFAIKVAEKPYCAAMSWVASRRVSEMDSSSACVLALSKLFSKRAYEGLSERVLEAMVGLVLTAIANEDAADIRDAVDGVVLFASWSQQDASFGWAEAPPEAWNRLSAKLAEELSGASIDAPIAEPAALAELFKRMDSAGKKGASFQSKPPRL